MRWHNGRSRRSRNLHSENAYQGSVVKKDESAAHSIQARRSLLQQRPDTFAQTNSVIFIFRLQYGGGPYIPDSGDTPGSPSMSASAIYRPTDLIHVAMRASCSPGPY